MSTEINHSARAHAEHSASGSDRWMNCAASAQEARKAPPQPGTIYAAEGTAAHELGEHCLRNGYQASRFIGWAIDGKGGLHKPEDAPALQAEYERLLGVVRECKATVDAADAAKEAQARVELTVAQQAAEKAMCFVVDAGMVEAVQVYLDDVRESYEPGDTLLYEQRYTLDKLNPPAAMFATADCVQYKPALKKLVVRDYKHGQGYAVEAEGNSQLRYYALAAYVNSDWEIDQIEVRIVQPRAFHADGAIRAETFDVIDLMDWTADLLGAVARTLEPNPPHNPGKWCKWCPAAGFCPGLREHSLAVLDDFDDLTPPSPEAMTPEQISAVLDKAAIVEQWIGSLRAYAHHRLEQGGEIPGYKLVPKRAQRRWISERDAAACLRGAGLLDEDIYTRKIISPAQAEKALGKSRKKEIADFVIAESSGSTLARDGDARAALPPTIETSFDILD